MEILKKKVSYFFMALFYAWLYYQLTLGIWMWSDGNALIATLGNIAAIFAFMVLDKGEAYLIKKAKTKGWDESPKTFMRGLMWYLYGPSMKSSLYLFYVIVLIGKAILAADPYFPILSNMAISHLPFMEYGLMVLIAGDKFLSRLFKDVAER
ncbi:MAG: hypothetical protein FWC69_02610 [Defluviitaleaceae bacterium]|nr:hypothetical protein [Defluviitaleaceae bacterium]